ncbi:hypothetical protein K474DRAFT_1657613, partial [Panus rudis PR-1116 ss-1]
MADLYPTYGRQFQQRQDSQSYVPAASNVQYPPQIVTSQPNDDHNTDQHDSDSQSPTAPSPKQESPTAQKQDGLQQQPAKPQATFLTKLYALLERPENHHMIRWDAAGEHIIVERPEQLALHVLPSVYRQSRFASFSRQLNIYGFMRKVNLRNVDPAIDDPDASTWSHPTLNRHSPPEVVANFKRRVPPRLPKPRKRDSVDPSTLAGPRSAVGSVAPLSLAVPSGPSSPGKGVRPRGFSAPGSFPLSQPTAPGWNTTYTRSQLPPLTVPEAPSMTSQSSMYSHSPHHTLHPISTSEDTQGSTNFSPMSYTSSSSREAMMLPSPTSHYSYSNDQSNWSFSANSASASQSTGSLSSLLNPSSSYSSARPSTGGITSYPSYSSMQSIRTGHNGNISPDSRPATGYSVASSMSSLPTPYDESAPPQFAHHDYSRPNSSHHVSGRPITPTSRPQSSKASYPQSGSLLIRRDRRHSHAMSPYPSPYGEHPPASAGSDRPSTSPQPGDEHLADTYGFNPAQGDFAYHPVDDGRQSHGHLGHGGHAMYSDATGRSIRPSTSASSLSTSSSAANTPAGEVYHPAGHEGANIRGC